MVGLGSEDLPQGGSGSLGPQLCFRVPPQVRRVWLSLPRSERMALTSFFRKAIASYATAKTLLSLDPRDIAALVDTLRVGFEACRASSEECRERLDEVEKRLAAERKRVDELEQEVEKLRRELEQKTREIEKLKKGLQQLEKVSKLRLLLCSAADRNPELKKELEKIGIEEMCR